MSQLTIPGKQIGSVAIRHGQSLVGLHASAEYCSEMDQFLEMRSQVENLG